MPSGGRVHHQLLPALRSVEQYAHSADRGRPFLFQPSQRRSDPGQRLRKKTQPVPAQKTLTSAAPQYADTQDINKSHLLSRLELEDVEAPHPIHTYSVANAAVQYPGRVDVPKGRRCRVRHPQRPQELRNYAPDKRLREHSALLLNKALRQGLGSRVEITHKSQCVPMNERLRYTAERGGRESEIRGRVGAELTLGDFFFALHS